AGVTTVPTGAGADLSPEVGITGTPVIDPSTGTLYVVAKTQQTTGKRTTYALALHALEVGTGAEAVAPVVVKATVHGRGTGSLSSRVFSRARWEIQRRGLLLDDGVVYAAFGSLADQGPYHGWVIGYRASDLARVGVFNDTPNSRDSYNNLGGIWMDGGAPAAD